MTSPEEKYDNLNTVYRVPGDDSDDDSEDRSREASTDPKHQGDRVNLATSDRQNVQDPGVRSFTGSLQVPQAIEESNHKTSHIVVDTVAGSIKLPQVNDLFQSADRGRGNNRDKAAELGSYIDTNHQCPGTSQKWPIDLEKPDPEKHFEISDDSDEEGPEALPISQKAKKTLLAVFDSARDCTTQTIPGSVVPKQPLITVSEKRTTVPEEERAASDSDSYLSESEVGYPGSADDARLSSIGDSASDCSSEPDDTYSIVADDGEPTYPSEEPNKLGETAAYRSPPLCLVESFAKSRADVKDCKQQLARTEVEDSQLTTVPQSRKPYTDFLCVASGSQEGSGRKPTPRAPSPSDAALARPICIPAIKYPRTHEQSHMFPPPPVTPFFAWSQPRDNLHNQGLSITDAPASWADFAQSSTSGNYGGYTQDNCLGEMERGLPRYEDGPFAGWNRYDATPQVAHNVNNPGPRTCYSRDNLAPYLDAFSSSYEQTLWENEVPPKPTITHVSAPPNVATPEKVEGKATKLPISDIVNEASSQSKVAARSLKRKADEMTCVDDFDVPETHYETQNNDMTNKTQDSALPDAQPREELVSTDASLPEEVLEVITEAFEPKPSHDLQAPARKKAKLAPSGSRPVRAFVSGVLVGCISLAGACAAFIATIPDAVKDEARREFF